MEMKTGKKILLILLVLFLVVFANGCYYVFWGQHRSEEKLRQGKELNVYECVSIYTMHTALWMFFWPCSPGAAMETFMMQFNRNPEKTVRHKNRYVLNSLLSPKILSTMLSLELNESKRVSWNGDIAYDLSHPEHKAAMALNACDVSREIDKKTGKEVFAIRLNNSWADWSETRVTVTKGFSIYVQEALFKYLQKKRIINSFVDEYVYPVDVVLSYH